MAVEINSLADRGIWTVKLLPLPRRQTMAQALGFCGGHIVGLSQGSGSRSIPQWWRDGGAEPLQVEGKKRVNVGIAHGREIPGAWMKADGDLGGAVGWRLDDAGQLLTVDLHDDRLAWTFAASSGGGAFAGYGQYRAKNGARVWHRALFWRHDGTMVELAAPADVDAQASGTDGAYVVGRIRHQAVLWEAGAPEAIMLGSEGAMTEARAVRDGEQVGSYWQGMRGRAALWRGNSDSFVDLTPARHESAAATDCAAGLQIGYCRIKDLTRGGASNMATRAALWSGSAESHVNLHAMLPEPWNASSAWAIEVHDDLVRIAGDATQFGVSNELTARENQYLVKQMAVVWEARLS